MSKEKEAQVEEEHQMTVEDLQAQHLREMLHLKCQSNTELAQNIKELIDGEHYGAAQILMGSLYNKLLALQEEIDPFAYEVKMTAPECKEPGPYTSEGLAYVDEDAMAPISKEQGPETDDEDTPEPE